MRIEATIYAIRRDPRRRHRAMLHEKTTLPEHQSRSAEGEGLSLTIPREHPTNDRVSRLRATGTQVTA